MRLMPHCRDSDRIAMVVEMPPELGFNCVKIMFLDNGRKVPATKNNLEILSERRKNEGGFTLPSGIIGLVR